MTLTARTPILDRITSGYRLNREALDSLRQRILFVDKDPAEKIELLQRIEQVSIGSTFYHLTAEEQQAAIDWIDQVSAELKVRF